MVTILDDCDIDIDDIAFFKFFVAGNTVAYLMVD